MLSEFEANRPSAAARHLADDETRLQDYLDGRLAPRELEAAEAHLAACEKCRAACQEWRQLDLTLTRALKRPALSAGFTSRLWQEIQRSTQVSEQTAPARAGEPSEAEWPARWAEYRKRFLRQELSRLLDWIGYGAALAVAAGLLGHFAQVWLQAAPRLVPEVSVSLALSVSVGVSSLFLLAALGFVGRHQLSRWLAKL